MIAQFCIPTAELEMPTGTQTNDANSKIETKPVTVEVKIRVQHNLDTCQSSHAFHSLNHYVLFYLKDNLLFHLPFSVIFDKYLSLKCF